MKACTYCGKEYSDEASVCTIDSQPLRPIGVPEPAPVKHSGLGIASFAISIAVGFLMFVLLIVAGLLNKGRVEHGQTYPGQTIVGLLLMFLMAVDVVAAGLGIGGLCEAGRRRTFALLGLVFSSATILGAVGLVIIGLTYAAKFAR